MFRQVELVITSTLVQMFEDRALLVGHEQEGGRFGIYTYVVEQELPSFDEEIRRAGIALSESTVHWQEALRYMARGILVLCHFDMPRGCGTYPDRGPWPPTRQTGISLRVYICTRFQVRLLSATLGQPRIRPVRGVAGPWSQHVQGTVPGRPYRTVG
ncbi:hypothetical protein F4859DRAFT_407003 [Xylaria cf. heliscus]|nr:hypothetical protein F4859DRAFT_407003 [Xylaria cf. heliscus]